MFKLLSSINIRFTEPIDLYIKKCGDTIEVIQISYSDAVSELLFQDEALKLVPDYTRCSVIHDFGKKASEPKSVTVEIADTLVLVDGDICNLTNLPDVYTVSD